MKKIIGILCIAAFSMSMLLNTDKLTNSNADFNLASLVSINSANAEQGACIAETDCPGGGEASCLGLQTCYVDLYFVTCDGETTYCF